MCVLCKHTEGWIVLQIQSLGWNFSLFPVSVGNFKQIKAVPPPEPKAIGLPPTQWHSSHPGLFLGTLLEEEVGEVGLGWGGTRGYVCRVGWRGVGVDRGDRGERCS